MRGLLIIAVIIWLLGAAAIALMVRDEDNDSPASEWLRRHPLPDVAALLCACTWPLVLAGFAIYAIAYFARDGFHDLVRRRRP